MANSDTHVTRLARSLSAVTSIFRCNGLQHTPADADRFGGHDLLYWILFVGLLSGWFLFFFAPQHERLSMLEGRRHVLGTHMALEKRELKRLQRSIDDLARGDPHAWERAARGRLGWVEPGEVTDLASWNPGRLNKPALDAHRAAPPVPSIAPPVLPRPAIPPIPLPSPAMRRTQIMLSEAVNTEILGPTRGSPPVRAPAPRTSLNTPVEMRSRATPANRTLVTR